MSSLAAPAAPSLQELLVSQAAVALWLRFQCDPAKTLHESYREVLVAEAKRNQARGQKGNKPQASEDSEKDSVWLKRLWGTALLSRFVCERFSLQIEAWPRVPSDLSFFLRLVMLDSSVLLRLLRSVGLVLSAFEIAAVIESEEVARLKEGLGEGDYAFAMTTGMRLRPARERVVLRVGRKQRASLADAAFHTVVGLRLLILQGEGMLNEQHWRRLALKCPRGIVDLLRQRSGQEMFDAAGVDEGTAAGLQVSIAVFEEDAQPSSVENWWCSVAKEVVGSWHAWLESSKVE